MKSFALSVLSASLLVAILPGQTPTQDPAPAPKAATKKRLSAALEKTASLSDTAFTIKWGPDKKVNKNNPFAQLLGQRSSGKVNGSWHKGQRALKFGGNEKDELIFRGGRMLARDDKRDWCLRSNHWADGNKIDHVPDPQSLVQLLATWPLAVTNRTAGAFNDRPVEIISVTLNEEQVGELLWSGSLPATLATSQSNVFRIAQRLGGGGRGRTAATPPDVTIDLAIALDPGTNLVHEIRVRAWTPNDGNNNLGVFVVGGAVGGAVDDEEEEEEEEEPDENTPLVYENGLPKRPRKKVSVANFTLTLKDHGSHAAAELNERQLRLLR